jgi:hypothetical protein
MYQYFSIEEGFIRLECVFNGGSKKGCRDNMDKISLVEQCRKAGSQIEIQERQPIFMNDNYASDCSRFYFVIFSVDRPLGIRSSRQQA